ncbi:hypothetical protein PMIT1303_02309 [Prochlorococcus sp. MIT 1303]|nr:hypothetical protein PMIT1303_02309 [Prochlorococcus sp. MIT 1303]
MPITGKFVRIVCYFIVYSDRISMSKQSAVEFLQRMLDDEEFCHALEEAPDSSSRYKLVQAAGFDFTETELDETTTEILSDEELTDDDLAAIAGGNSRFAMGSSRSPHGTSLRQLGSREILSRMPSWLISGMRAPTGRGPDPTPNKGAYCGFYDCPV